MATPRRRGHAPRAPCSRAHTARPTFPAPLYPSGPRAMGSRCALGFAALNRAFRRHALGRPDQTGAAGRGCSDPARTSRLTTARARPSHLAAARSHHVDSSPPDPEPSRSRRGKLRRHHRRPTSLSTAGESRGRRQGRREKRRRREKRKTGRLLSDQQAMKTEPARSCRSRCSSRPAGRRSSRPASLSRPLLGHLCTSGPITLTLFLFLF